MTSPRKRWAPVVEVARAIVDSYDIRITLRQLFYRLVAARIIANTEYAYKRLSAVTAEGRRNGTFPELIDTTRDIFEWPFRLSAIDAVSYAAEHYRGNRQAGQKYAVYLGTEKRGLIAQLDSWFTEPFGIPVLPLGGFASHSFIEDVRRHVQHQRDEGRKTVLLYAGDFDASGVTIDKVFNGHTMGEWHMLPHRVALNPDQIALYGLARQRGKHKDSNVKAFVAEYGPEVALYDPAAPYITDRGKRYLCPVQVEMDALDPNTLRALFGAAIEPYWDKSAYTVATNAERREKSRARVIAEIGARYSTTELRELLSQRPR